MRRRLESNTGYSSLAGKLQGILAKKFSIVWPMRCNGEERRDFGRRVCRSCLCCALLEDPITFSFYLEVQKVATGAIGWLGTTISLVSWILALTTYSFPALEPVKLKAVL